MALVAQAKREVLLRVHRHRLCREDLEDCYSQATLELLTTAREGAGGGVHRARAHMANVLEQRFLSRIYDRRRALRGRSQAALDHALPLGDGGGIEIADVRAEIERLVMLRMDLRNLGTVIHELTPDQRLVLTSAVDTGMECVEFCDRFGWSREKYRKVAQRARVRLHELLQVSEESFCARSVPSGAGGRRGR